MMREGVLGQFYKHRTTVRFGQNDICLIRACFAQVKQRDKGIQPMFLDWRVADHV